jgi:hypothetical protein
VDQWSGGAKLSKVSRLQPTDPGTESSSSCAVSLCYILAERNDREPGVSLPQFHGGIQPLARVAREHPNVGDDEIWNVLIHHRLEGLGITDDSHGLETESIEKPSEPHQAAALDKSPRPRTGWKWADGLVADDGSCRIGCSGRSLFEDPVGPARVETVRLAPSGEWTGV